MIELFFVADIHESNVCYRKGILKGVVAMLDKKKVKDFVFTSG